MNTTTWGLFAESGASTVMVGSYANKGAAVRAQQLNTASQRSVVEWLIDCGCTPITQTTYYVDEVPND